jgi:hypothetical protein
MMRRYTHDEMHNALSAQSTGRNADGGDDQAFLCPYYVKLCGVLGTDWGVIVNPTSTRFGLVTFEHDRCGCEEGAHDPGRQRTDEWRDRTREREAEKAAAERRRG